MVRDYGGAFDINPTDYWTREDVNEVISAVEDIFAEKKMKVFITGGYINYNEKHNKDIFDIDWHYETTDGEHHYGSLHRNIWIDRRKAQVTEQLVKVYAPEIAQALEEELSELSGVN